MNQYRQHPWYGLDDVGEEIISWMGSQEPGSEPMDPDKKKKIQHDHDNPAIQKGEDIPANQEKPWVQEVDRDTDETEIGVNEVHDYENGDPPIDDWAEPEKRDDVQTGDS